MTPQIFICHSHQDEDWKERLLAHLGVLLPAGLLSVWDDRQLPAGEEWPSAVKQAIASSRVALLLVSAGFLASEFVNSEEAARLLGRGAAGGPRMIPVILKPCAWQEVPWLGGGRARPRDGRALSEMDDFEAEVALTSLVLEIEKLLHADLSPRAHAAPAKKIARPLAGAVSALALALALWQTASVWLRPPALPQNPAAPAALAEPPKPPKPAPAALPRDFKDCPQCPAMVELPPGKFLMGSPDAEAGRDGGEGPPHEVRIDYRLALGKYEVSFDEWDACEAAKACPHAGDNGWGRGLRPVVNVSWEDAQAYILWLNGKTDRHYRLPSEAEWEYAARAGTATPFSTGRCIEPAQANYSGDADYDRCPARPAASVRKTQPAGHYPANPWGLFDLHGNVWEWVQDCHHDSYDGAPGDGAAWDGGKDCAGNRRVLRGGSWVDSARDVRSAARNGFAADFRYDSIGFRLARTLAR